jgi:hypothetical protein
MSSVTNRYWICFNVKLYEYFEEELGEAASGAG